MNVLKKKTKCYIYTRVSTAIQVDGYSLDAQKDKLRKYAEFQDMEIVGEYSDEGHSGKNIKGRQEFMRMLNDIEDGKDGVDFVLVFKLSRFGGNAADVLSSLQLMQSQIDDVLAKLITAMTREGKFKDAIQDRIGATVDTSDLEKQLSVLNANLHQTETIKTRLEQQMDNLDVTDIHYDKKISDLQRRLDTQYDKIDEVEEAIADLKSQVYELKKNQIDADSIYGFLNAFNELYAECSDVEKKQFMQAFIERIDIFPERREDGNWIRNIKFKFPVPILRDGKEIVRVDGISLDKEQSDEHTVTLEKFPTLETVCLLSRKAQ